MQRTRKLAPDLEHVGLVLGRDVPVSHQRVDDHAPAVGLEFACEQELADGVEVEQL